MNMREVQTLGGGWLASTVMHALALVALALWALPQWIDSSAPLRLQSSLSGEVEQPESFRDEDFHGTDLALESRPLPELAEVPRNAPEIAALTLEAAPVAPYSSHLAPPTRFNNIEIATRAGPDVEFLGNRAHGTRFAFVLDASGSMNEGRRFARAVEELIDTIERFTPDQEFFVVLFHTYAVPMLGQPLYAPAMLPGTEENKQRLVSWLAGLRPTGWSDARGALELAFALDPSAVFLLSDGEFQTGPPKKKLGQETLRLARRLNQAKAPIYTVAFEDPVNARALRIMAHASGGSFRYIPPERR